MAAGGRARSDNGSEKQANIGIKGLDDVLGRGLKRRVFLTLYISMSETGHELPASAASHGCGLSGVELFELIPPENLLDEDQQQSLLYWSDLKLGETTKRIFEVFKRIKPDRVVLDSLPESGCWRRAPCSTGAIFSA